MTERIQQLKNVLNSKTEFTNWFILEKLKMQSYKQTEGQPMMIRRAKMLEKMLLEMPISIPENERIIGTLDDVFVTSYNLFKNELETFEGYCGYRELYKEVEGVFPAEEIKEVSDFWLNDRFETTMASLFTPEQQAAMNDGVYFVEPVTGHSIYDAPEVLANGYNGILEHVKAAAAKNNDEERAVFYQSVEIALEAAKKFAARYADLAAEMAQKETNEVRKAELSKLAQTLRRVPANPAESFYDAVVSYFLTYVIMHIEQTPNPYAFSLGRVDQFLYPYFKADKEKNEITEEYALELIEELWLKINVGNKVWAVSQNAVVGGVTRDGEDATNELTYIIINATEELAIPLPTLTIKLHKNSPEKLVERAAANAAKGRGNPTVVNDDVVVESKMATGVSLEDARDSVIAGCQEFVVQGAENARTTSCWFSLPKCLEITLNGGKSVLTGNKMGLDFGDLDSLNSFDEFYEIYWKQIDYFIAEATAKAGDCDKTLATNRPVPFSSAIFKDCIDNGSDYRMNGCRYNFSGFLCHGVSNAGDALFAIKKLVFDEKKTTFKELNAAINANWVGYEKLHSEIMAQPKFGNDIDEVDSLVVKMADRVSATAPTYQNFSKATFRPGYSTPSTHVLYGRKCAATPDGRYHRDSFGYGFGPMQGVNVNGPTAVINSCTKFDHRKALHGLSFNLSFPCSAIDGENGVKLLQSMISVYHKKGGRYLQFNIQDVETLRKAQKEPEKYKDLIVRVHGMSAYFVNLDPLIQEDIIVRVASGI